MTTQVVFTRQAQRRDTAANWTAVNPVLLSGEWGLETDTRKLKIGDGVTAWNALAYNGGTPGGPGDPTNLSITNRTATGLDVASSTGNDATVPLATETLAGLLAPGTRAKAEGAVQAVALTPPSGWSSSSTNTGGSVTLTLGLPSGFSLPSNAIQATWTAGAELADTAVQEGDIRLTDSREWSAATVSQATAEAGTSTTRVAYNPLRVFQSIAAWWAASEFKAKVDGIASNATANATNEQLRDRSTHTGTQPASTITGLGTAATAATSDFATPAALTAGLATKADLVEGVVPTSQIPAIALVQYLGQVSSQAAMLALRGQGGDWCIRTDGGASEWVIVANNGALLADWVQMPTGTAGVSSINAQTGAVTLGTGDLSESGGNLFFTAARAIGAALTGFTAGAGTVAETDSILQAFQKVAGNIANRALAGLIGSSGLTMATNRLAGRFDAGAGAVQEITPAGGLSLQSGNLVMTEGIALFCSEAGETVAARLNHIEKAVNRACTVIAVTWELAPTSSSTSGSSQAMLYARRSGTKTPLLTGNASLPATTGIFTDVSGTLTGTPTLAAGDTLGVDLNQVGTGASGLILTAYVRYS